jgi:hypothetical protein
MNPAGGHETARNRGAARGEIGGEVSRDGRTPGSIQNNSGLPQGPAGWDRL